MVLTTDTDWREQVRQEIQAVPLLSISALRELPEAEEFDGGVYFLWLADQLQYIGKATHILERLNYQHMVNRYHKFQQSRSAVHIPHDRHTALVLERGRIRSDHIDFRLQQVERRYIDAYPTPFNNPTFSPFT